MAKLNTDSAIKLYNAVKDAGYDIGDYNAYMTKLQSDPTNADNLYKALHGAGFDIGNDYASKLYSNATPIPNLFDFGKKPDVTIPNAGNGYSFFDGRQTTDDRRQTTDNGQRTTDDRQRTTVPLTDEEAQKVIYGNIPGTTKIGDVSFLPTGGGYQNTKGKAPVQKPNTDVQVAVPGQSVYGNAPQVKMPTITSEDIEKQAQADLQKQYAGNAYEQAMFKQAQDISRGVTEQEFNPQFYADIPRGAMNATVGIAGSTLTGVGDLYDKAGSLSGIDFYADYGKKLKELGGKADKYVKQHSTGSTGEQFGGMLPMAGMAVADIASGGSLTPVITGTFAASGYGDGIKMYDELHPNGDGNEYAKTGAGLLYGAVMAGAGNYLMGKAIPKGLISEAVQSVFRSNPELLQTGGEAIVNAFAKQQPTLLKQLATNAGHSVMSMEAMELGKKGIDELYGKHSDVKDWINTATHAAVTGVVFSALTAPFSMRAQSAANTARRNAQGSVTLTFDAKGKPVEVIEGLRGLTPEGKEVKLTQENVNNSFTMTTDDFNRFMAEKGNAEVNDRDVFSNNVAETLKRMSGNGNVSVARDENGEALYVVGRQDGQLMGFDVEGQVRPIQEGADIQTAPMADVHNAIMAKWDEVNGSRQQTADSRQQITDNRQQTAVNSQEEILKKATEDATNFVSAITHAESGNVIEARLHGVDKPINITKGNVVLKEDGSVDLENSDKTFFYKTPDGVLHVGNIEFIEGINSVVPAQEAIDKSVHPVREQLENANAPEYGIGKKAVVVDNTDPQNPSNAIVTITGRDENGNYKVQRDMGNGQVQPGIVQPREILPQFSGVLDNENAAVDYIDPQTGETMTGMLELDTPDKQMMFANGYATIDGRQISFENVVGDNGRQTTDDRRRTTDNGLQATDSGQQITNNTDEANGLQAAEAGDAQGELGQGGNGEGVQKTDNGQQTTDDGQRTTDNGRQTTDNGRQTTKYSEEDLIPQDDKGNLLFEQARPELTVQFLKDNFEPEEIVPTVVARINAINKEISKQEAFKPTGNIQKDALTKQAKREALNALNGQLGYWKDIQEQVTPRNYKPQNETVAQRDARWGEPTSLREMIIRKFIGGVKLRWDDETSADGAVISRGLGGEYRYSNDERKAHISFISANGVTPEQLAHSLWQANAYEQGQFEDMPLYGMDTQDILNEILDVMNSYRSTGEMIKSVDEIRDRYNEQEQAYIDALVNDAKNQKNVLETVQNEMDDATFAQLAGVVDLTEEQQNELKNLQNDDTNRRTTEAVVGSDSATGSQQSGETGTGVGTIIANGAVDEGGNKPGDSGFETIDKSAPQPPNGGLKSQAEIDTEELDANIASQEHNTNPTEKQKETGIYPKARVNLQGYNITLETLKGTERSGIDEGGQKWSVTMQNHYGELDGTKGYDGDPIDVFIGPNPKEGGIFVVDQASPNPSGLPLTPSQGGGIPIHKFDESKVMLGFDSAEEAKAAYLSNYEPGWDGFGAITPAGDNFKEWLYDGKKQRKPFSEYVGTPDAVERQEPGIKSQDVVDSEERAAFQIKENENTDKQYFTAIERGDMETAQRIVDQQAVKNGYVSKEDYRLSHRAPSADTTPSQEKMDSGGDFNLVEIANGYSNQPSDYFDVRNGARWYGYDYYSGRQSQSAINSAIRAIKAGENPTVTIYRAVEKSLKENEIRNGDWVTLSSQYAKEHGQQHIDGPYRIISQEVPAENVWWDGNDINEWGYDDGKEYAYKNTKNNRKLTDVIVRDDNGEIIPPSKRFNQRIADIRFQLNTKQFDTAKTPEEKYASGKAIIDQLDVESGRETVVAKDNKDFAAMLPAKYEQLVMTRNIGGVYFKGGVIINVEKHETTDSVLAAYEHEYAHKATHEIHSNEQLAEMWVNSSESDKRLLRSAYADNPDWVKGDELISLAVEDIIEKQGYENYKSGNIDLSSYSETLQEPLKQTIEYANKEYLDNLRRRNAGGNTPSGDNAGEGNGDLRNAVDGRSASALGREDNGTAGQSQSDVSGAVSGGSEGVLQGPVNPIQGDLPATIDVDGVERSTSNSLGQPIHPTESGVINFWKWFGDSKVVDKQGRPLVVYHGSISDFNEFKLMDSDVFGTKFGHFFTPDKDIAQIFADRAENGVLYETYLKLEHPKKINGFFWDSYSRYKGADASLRKQSPKEYKGSVELPDFKAFREQLQAEGNDGVVLNNISIQGEKTRIVKTPQYIVFDSTQIKSATGNNGEFGVDDADIRHQIIGEKGATVLDKAEEATTRLDNLRVAKEMEARTVDNGDGVDRGFTPQEIRMATGWEKGVDGLWRYEMPDGEVNEKHYADLLERKWNEDIKSGLINATSLGELYNNKELYYAYPDLKNIHVIIYEDKNTDVSASYSPGENAIYIFNPHSLKTIEGRDSFLIHEIQHAIQDIEGFARGGNVDSMKQSGEELISMVEDIENLIRIAEKNNVDLKTAYENTKGIWKNEQVVEYNSNKTIDEVKSVLKTIKSSTLSPLEQYRRLAGEVEARNASARMNMSAEERRNTLLAETADVAPEDQIVLMDGLGVSESRSVGGNSGYIGYSMSKRAAQARENGKYPKTDFKKEYSVTENSVKSLVDAGIINDREWHHTSKFGNKTTFYQWEESHYQDIYAENKKEIDKISNDKELSKNEISDKIQSIFENHELTKQAEKQAEQERINSEILRKKNTAEQELTSIYTKDQRSKLPTELETSNGAVVYGLNGSPYEWYAMKDGERLSKRNRQEERNVALQEATEYVKKSGVSFDEWKRENKETVADVYKKNGVTPEDADIRFQIQGEKAENKTYFGRISNHIHDDIERGWSSWNFGTLGFEGTKADLINEINSIAPKYDDYDNALLEAFRNNNYKDFYEDFYVENYSVDKEKWDDLNRAEKNEYIEDWKDDAIRLKNESNDNAGTINISGFDLPYTEAIKAFENNQIRELYPDYWVLVDDRFDDGNIAGIYLNSDNFEDAKKEVLDSNNDYKYTGDGTTINTKEAKLVYSNGSKHIFEIPNDADIRFQIQTPNAQMGAKYKGSRTTPEYYKQAQTLDDLFGIGKPVHDKKGGEPISEYYKRVKAWSVANNPQAWGEADRKEVEDYLAGITPDSYEDKAQQAQAAAQAAGATVVDEPKPVFQQDGHTMENVTDFARRVVAWREQRFINGIVRAEREAEAREAVAQGFTPMDHEIARMELDMQLRTVYDSLGKLIGKQPAKWLEQRAGNKEMWADSLLPVKTFLDYLRSRGVKIPDIDDYYLQATALQGKNDTGFNNYVRKYQKPVNKWIHDTMKTTGFNYRDIENYVFLKHGVERNDYFKQDGKHQKADYAGVYAIAAELYAKDNGIPFDPKEKNEIGKVLKEYANANGITLNETTESGVYDELFANKKDVIDQAQVDKNRAFFDKIVTDYISNFESESNGKGRIINDFWAKLNDANNFSLNTMADAGIITRTQADEIKSRYQYFIPLRGHEVEAEKTYEYSPDAGVFFSNPAIKAHGRISRAEHPFSYIAQMAQSAVVMKNNNDLKKTMLRLARKDKTGLFSVNRTWYIKTGTDAEGMDIWEEAEITADEFDELNRAEWEAWNERMKELEKEGRAKQFTKGVDLDGLFIKKKQKKQHAITIIENGEEYQVYINANPRISRAINGLNKSEQDKVMRFLSSVKGTIGLNMTSRNPAFMAANFSRDVIFAASILPAKEGGEYTAQFLSNIPIAAKELIQYQINPDNAPQHVQEFLENGGETGYSHLWELQDMQKQIDKAVAQGMSVSKAWDAIVMPIDVMNKIVENTTRLAVYKTSRENGRTVERSINDAKEVSLNFNKTGAGGGIVDYVRGAYLFVNAGVQALNNFTKVYKEHPVKMTGIVMSYMMSGLMMSLINGMLLQLSGDDEDEYWNLPEYERQNNLCIWIGNGFVKIPLPQELRVFHRIGDNVASHLWNKKPMSEAMVNAGAGLLDLIPANPSGPITDSWAEAMPDALKPFAQVWANKTFTGAAIAKDESFMKSGVPQWRQVRTNRANEPKAPSGIIWLSAELNAALGGDQYRSAGAFEKAVLNPDKLNHLARGYFGGIYTTATQGLGTITDRFYMPEKDLEEKATGGNLQNAYNKIDEAEQRVNQFKQIVEDLKQNKIDRVQFAKDTLGTNYGEAKRIQKLGSRLREINKVLKENQDLPEEEKKQLLEAQKTILKMIEDLP